MSFLSLCPHQAVALESRAEAAENDRDDALERARVFTPRPAPNFEQVQPQLNEEAASLLTEMIDLYRSFAPPPPSHNTPPLRACPTSCATPPHPTPRKVVDVSKSLWRRVGQTARYSS